MCGNWRKEYRGEHVCAAMYSSNEIPLWQQKMPVCVEVVPVALDVEKEVEVGDDTAEA